MDVKYAIREIRLERLDTLDQSTGFRCFKINADNLFSIEGKEYNHLLFLLEGELVISCNEFSKHIIKENEFVMIPISADMVGRATTNSRILIFSFDMLPDSFDKEYMQSLLELSSSLPYEFTPNPIHESLHQFLFQLSLYSDEGLKGLLIHSIKKEELFVIFRSFYTKREIAALLHPIIGYSTIFRTQVLRYYRQANSIDDFADIFNMEKRSFTRQFKEEFGCSPYKWLLDQKAKHVKFSLSETNHSLDEIRKEHGFRFAAHFTRFCWEQFSCSPVKLRRQLRGKS